MKKLFEWIWIAFLILTTPIWATLLAIGYWWERWNGRA